MTLDDLLEAWRVNNAVNLRLLGLCPEEVFDLKPGSGKTVRSNWVHLVGVRRMHVDAMLRAAVGAVPKLDWKTATRTEIEGGLAASDAAMASVFARLDAKPNRWSAATLFAYSVAHDAHHRSQIEIALRLGGVAWPEMAGYELWDWPKM